MMKVNNMEKNKTGNEIIKELLLMYKEYRNMDDASFLYFCRRYSHRAPTIVVEYLREIYGSLPFNSAQLIQEEMVKFVEEYERIL